jgi:hypothetical protein
MTRSDGPDSAARTKGPWPFVTLRRYRLGRHLFVWQARQSRKGLLPRIPGWLSPGAAEPFWRTSAYNWYTGGFFAIGSLLFMLGAILSVLPVGWAIVPSVGAINLIFFSGSVPFTIAGYLQHFQAANAPEFDLDSGTATPRGRVSFLGWHPRDPGWISTFAQFIGTVAFNFNTFDAIHAPAGWVAQDMVIWAPGLIGSILFLVSGYLAFIETCHAYWAWRPRSLDWWIVFVNLLGCVFFMTAGILAYVPQGSDPIWIVATANIHLALGAFGFLVGAVLMMVESARAPDSKPAGAG